MVPIVPWTNRKRKKREYFFPEFSWFLKVGFLNKFFDRRATFLIPLSYFI